MGRTGRAAPHLASAAQTRGDYRAALGDRRAHRRDRRRAALFPRRLGAVGHSDHLRRPEQRPLWLDLQLQPDGGGVGRAAHRLADRPNQLLRLLELPNHSGRAARAAALAAHAALAGLGGRRALRPLGRHLRARPRPDRRAALPNRSRAVARREWPVYHHAPTLRRATEDLRRLARVRLVRRYPGAGRRANRARPDGGGRARQPAGPPQANAHRAWRSRAN